MTKRKKAFVIQPFKNWDKDIFIEEAIDDSWSALRIMVDFDDVNHPVIKKKMKKMVKILNEHWSD